MLKNCPLGEDGRKVIRNSWFVVGV